MLLLAVGGLERRTVRVLRHRPVTTCSNTRSWMRFLVEKESNSTPRPPRSNT
jgi:hypothetical protein